MKVVQAMAKRRKTDLRSGIPAALLCVGGAGLVAAPSAVLALGGTAGENVGRTALENFVSFTPASVNPRLARLVAERSASSGKMMAFTPAGSANRPGHSVTVAVRVDEAAAQLISVHSALAAAQDQTSGAALRIASTRYNLGLSRGYRSFVQTPQLAKSLSDAAIPDLASFKPAEGVKDQPSRFNARIAMEEEQNAGRAPRTLEGLGDQTFDLGGSYRVTRNLDVTAGVRYSQDRNQLAPLTNGKQDSQAVYVGTQFRF